MSDIYPRMKKHVASLSSVNLELLRDRNFYRTTPDPWQGVHASVDLQTHFCQYFNRPVPENETGENPARFKLEGELFPQIPGQTWQWLHTQ